MHPESVNEFLHVLGDAIAVNQTDVIDLVSTRLTEEGIFPLKKTPRALAEMLLTARRMVLQIRANTARSGTHRMTRYKWPPRPEPMTIDEAAAVMATLTPRDKAIALLEAKRRADVMRANADTSASTSTPPPKPTRVKVGTKTTVTTGNVSRKNIYKGIKA